MSHAGAPPVPCPVPLGQVKAPGRGAELHRHTLDRNLPKMEKLLRQGVDVDTANNLGQTPLFCAALLGLTSAVELLLQYGANPNHRCEDRSTPVHAAAFSCNPWLVSGLLEAGGDLRLHDQEGRTPEAWAREGPQEHSSRMLDFLQRCVACMQSFTQPSQARDSWMSRRSCKTLVPSPSLLERFRQGGSDLHVNRKPNSKLPSTVQCYGFGKLCAGGPSHATGFLACTPMIEDRELAQAEDEPLLSFSCGAFMSMTNYSWNGCRVTVKELQAHNAVHRGSRDCYLDLLIIEQEYCSQLFHPHLLQLLAVSVSADSLRPRLVFERVHIGSLYDLLHHRRAQFPVLRMDALLPVVLQVCDALVYLHCRSLVLRSLSSHAVLLVHPGVAKITGLHFMELSDGNPLRVNACLPLPPELYNWAAPEVIRGRPCTGKADLYSLCALLQELHTDAVPWGAVGPRGIRQAVEGGQALAADERIPPPYYALVRSGLQPRPQDRSPSLQDLRLQLRSDVKELSQSSRQRWGSCSAPAIVGAGGWVLETVQDPKDHRALPVQEGQPQRVLTDSAVHREILDQLGQLDRLLEGEHELRAGTGDGALEGHEGGGPGLGQALSDPPHAFRASEVSIREILPLDAHRLSLHHSLDSDSSRETGSDGTPTQDELEEEGEDPAQKPCEISQAISASVLNLKVSQVLLQQSESSLLNVQRARAALGRREVPSAVPWGQGERQLAVGREHVCGGGGLADEVDGRQSEKTEDSLDSGSEWGFSRAVGPPSHYRFAHPGYGVPARGWPSGLRRAAQSAAADEPPDWPAEHEDLSEGEGISDYSSALDDSFVTVRPGRAQAGRGSIAAAVAETGGQHSCREQCTVHRQGPQDRFTGFSRPTGPTQHRVSASGLSGCHRSAAAKWTSEVTQVVEKMTRGRLGSAAWTPSSESEDTEDRTSQFSHLCRPQGSGHKGSERPGHESQGSGSSQGSTKLERLFKSFAGVQSESESDAEFHTINRTFSLSARLLEDTGSRQEDVSSESEGAESPAEESDEFVTPIPGSELHKAGRQAQTQTPSSEEDLEVTEEVCRPSGRAVPAMAACDLRTGTTPTESSAVVSDPAERTDPAALQRVSYPTASCLPDIADLSSIVCEEEWPSREGQQPSPVKRNAPTCNSTPLHPGAVSRHHPRLGGEPAELLPPLHSLLDTFPWGSSPTQLHTADTFTTASAGMASPSDLSVSSALLPPRLDHSPVHRETDTPAGCCWDTPSAGTSAGQDGGSCAREGGPGGPGGPGRAAAECRDVPGEALSPAVDGQVTRSHDEPGSGMGAGAPGTQSPHSHSPAAAAEAPAGPLCAPGPDDHPPPKGPTGIEAVSPLSEKDLPGPSVLSGTGLLAYSRALDGLPAADARDLEGGQPPSAEAGSAGHGVRIEAPSDETLREGRSLLEETDRAHSTLDEVLQGMMGEKGSTQKSLRSPRPEQLPRIQESLYSEDTCCPAAAGGERAGKPEEPDSRTALGPADSVDEQGEKFEPGLRVHWAQPHRLIILEQTPTKSQSDPGPAMTTQPAARRDRD
ncbi:inactive serine/threonine-protein kinase TEX14 isoform X1 [Lepisosteus oculatus]|uniref:inactive serine/threonine-protein kinase TEX14 isoform X1 n=1 Tax=Lepisosteus oculatus TaxID=7918 RepID=UPI00371B9E39